MPTEPSVTIQVLPLDGVAVQVLEFPEREELNFFSILFQTGLKIAKTEPQAAFAGSSAAASNAGSRLSSRSKAYALSPTRRHRLAHLARAAG
jgi:hypothetical protein